jgi:hypothetical protein
MNAPTSKPHPAAPSRPCDALLATHPAIGACSSDRVQVWHGMDTPAIACGRHATYDQTAVFNGHRNRAAHA